MFTVTWERACCTKGCFHWEKLSSTWSEGLLTGGRSATVCKKCIHSTTDLNVNLKRPYGSILKPSTKLLVSKIGVTTLFPQTMLSYFFFIPTQTISFLVFFNEYHITDETLKDWNVFQFYWVNYSISSNSHYCSPRTRLVWQTNNSTRTRGVKKRWRSLFFSNLPLYPSSTIDYLTITTLWKKKMVKDAKTIKSRRITLKLENNS